MVLAYLRISGSCIISAITSHEILVSRLLSHEQLGAFPRAIRFLASQSQRIFFVKSSTLVVLRNLVFWRRCLRNCRKNFETVIDGRSEKH